VLVCEWDFFERFELIFMKSGERIILVLVQLDVIYKFITCVPCLAPVTAKAMQY